MAKLAHGAGGTRTFFLIRNFVIKARRAGYTASTVDSITMTLLAIRHAAVAVFTHPTRHACRSGFVWYLVHSALDADALLTRNFTFSARLTNCIVRERTGRNDALANFTKCAWKTS